MFGIAILLVGRVAWIGLELVESSPFATSIVIGERVWLLSLVWGSGPSVWNSLAVGLRWVALGCAELR